MSKLNYTTRIKNINVRVKEEELLKIELKASEQKMSLSEYVRKQLF